METVGNVLLKKRDQFKLQLAENWQFIKGEKPKAVKTQESRHCNNYSSAACLRCSKCWDAVPKK